MDLAWKPGIDKQTKYHVFVIKIRQTFVSLDNDEITRKQMSMFFSCDYLTIRQNVAREERLQFNRKKIMDFDYYEEYSEAAAAQMCS